MREDLPNLTCLTVALQLFVPIAAALVPLRLNWREVLHAIPQGVPSALLEVWRLRRAGHCEARDDLSTQLKGTLRRHWTGTRRLRMRRRILGHSALSASGLRRAGLSDNVVTGDRLPHARAFLTTL